MVADEHGRATFRLVDRLVKVSDVIGRSVVVSAERDDLGRGNSPLSKVGLAIVSWKKATWLTFLRYFYRHMILSSLRWATCRYTETELSSAKNDARFRNKFRPISCFRSFRLFCKFRWVHQKERNQVKLISQNREFPELFSLKNCCCETSAHAWKCYTYSLQGVVIVVVQICRYSLELPTAHPRDDHSLSF